MKNTTTHADTRDDSAGTASSQVVVMQDKTTHTVVRGFDYSRFDNLGDTDSESEKAATQQVHNDDAAYSMGSGDDDDIDDDDDAYDDSNDLDFCTLCGRFPPECVVQGSWVCRRCKEDLRIGVTPGTRRLGDPG